MEQQGQSSSPAVNSQMEARSQKCRNVWIVTGYGITGLVVFAILAYYVSAYIVH